MSSENNINNTQRTFIIGDKWAYFKIYSGPKTADLILTEAIKPLTERLIKNNLIQKWFFIRYADPKTHLRIRFLYNQPENISNIILDLNKVINPYIEKDLVWKLQADSYQRELERYGSNSIDEAETIFYHDSEMILNMLDLIEGDEGEIIRWKFCLRAVDSLLNDFEYSLEQKLDLLTSLKTGFGNEFGMNRNLKMQLDKKFRNERSEISNILNPNNDENSEIQPLFDLLKIKSNKISETASKLLKINEEEKLEISLNNLMGSYIHMLCNRLFKSKQRINEMVVYDFLYRHYNSEVAKKKYNKK